MKLYFEMSAILLHQHASFSHIYRGAPKNTLTALWVMTEPLIDWWESLTRVQTIRDSAYVESV